MFRYVINFCVCFKMTHAESLCWVPQLIDVVGPTSVVVNRTFFLSTVCPITYTGVSLIHS